MQSDTMCNPTFAKSLRIKHYRHLASIVWRSIPRSYRS